MSGLPTSRAAFSVGRRSAGDDGVPGRLWSCGRWPWLMRPALAVNGVLREDGSGVVREPGLQTMGACGRRCADRTRRRANRARNRCPGVRRDRAACRAAGVATGGGLGEPRGAERLGQAAGRCHRGPVECRDIGDRSGVRAADMAWQGGVTVCDGNQFTAVMTGW